MSDTISRSTLRGWAHDQICMSERCRGGGDNDHAKRTQAAFAREFSAAADETERIAVVHRALCIGAAQGTCRSEAHLAQIADEILPALTRGVAA